MDPNIKISMVGIDGGLKYVPSYMREELLKKGWKIIINPKREYYPEYDQSLQGFATESDSIGEEDENLLEVKVI